MPDFREILLKDDGNGIFSFGIFFSAAMYIFLENLVLSAMVFMMMIMIKLTSRPLSYS